MQVGIKLAPDRKKFMDILGGETPDLNSDIGKFCTNFSPLLQENHKFLVSFSHVHTIFPLLVQICITGF